MKAPWKVVLALLLGLPALVGAQPCNSTKGQLEYCNALTGAVKFGFPRYTTVLLPACGTTNKGAVAYDTTTDTVKYCTGSAWSAVGTTFTGGTITTPLLMPDGSVSAPALARSTQTNTGLYWLSNALVYGALGEGKWAFDSETLLGSSNSPIAWKSGTGLSGTTDLYLYRDAAGRMNLRNGTNAEQLAWSHTWTDASNYQGGVLKTSASGIEIAAETAGSGADNLNIVLSPAGAGQTQFFAGGGGPYWFISGIDGSFNSGFADAVDLGSSGAVRNLSLTRSIQGSKTKTLTDAAAAAAFVRIAVPQTVGSNYAGGDVVWTAFAADATPHTQSLSGRLTFTAINNAGTEVCAVDPTAAVTAPNANSSGTLQCTFSCASNAADTIDLMATCDTSLGTPTALSLLYRLDMPQPTTVTPQ